MIGMDGKRESGNSVISARPDDSNDIYICIAILIKSIICQRSI